MSSFPIKSGVRYRAEIHLSGYETWAGNGTVQTKLEEAGFSDVIVSGSGAVRYAEGVWSKQDVEDAVGIMPSQIYSVEEL
jgi:hypothetical protein